MRYWKVLDENGRSCHGGSFRWSLPRWDTRKGWVAGEWTPLITNIEACARGYHVCRDGDLLDWLNARIYACEIRGEIIEESNKVVAGQVRLTCPTPWDEVSARLFAVECASDVLSLYESKYPNDSRVSDCLEVAFRYALGDASDSERSAADWAADWAVDSAADWAAGSAYSAYLAADWAAYSAHSARSAAYSAAGSAAYLAARSAQTERLLWWLGVDA